MHGHSHNHTQEQAHLKGDPAAQRKRLRLTLGLTATYLVAEVVGGLWTGSLALLADAGHMLSDVAALSLSLFASWLASQPSPTSHTFGYRRAEILAALANGVALVVVAIFIMVEAVSRIKNPTPVLGGPMMAIASVGLVVNLVGLRILSGGKDESLNVRGAWLHVASDALGSVGAITAGAMMWAYGWQLADPIASIVIAVLVVFASVGLLRETVRVLLEVAPVDTDVEAVRAAIEGQEGVVDVRDLHIWTISNDVVALACNISTEAETDADILLSSLHKRIRDQFDIRHLTIQIEREAFHTPEADC